MRKPAAYLFAVLLGAVIWFFFQHFKLEGVNSVKLVSKNSTADIPEDERAQPKQGGEAALRPSNAATRAAPAPGPAERPKASSVSAALRGGLEAAEPPRSADVIRIASFHIDYLGRTKAARPHVLEIAARVIRKFDVVAIQGIQADFAPVIPQLVDNVNRQQARYDYVTDPLDTSREQGEVYCFIFDRSRVMVDRSATYTLGDPSNLLTFDPLVGWFRTVGPAADEAFTFSLVNFKADQRRIQQELDVLDDVIYEVHEDGRNEDDVILVGEFYTDDTHMGQLGQVSGLSAAIRGQTTDVNAQFQTENILFQRYATDEFTGRAGVLDFMREYNLTLEAAREVSLHLPVWAEFSIYEGGPHRRMAERTEGPRPYLP